jgi:hypothetical protein
MAVPTTNRMSDSWRSSLRSSKSLSLPQIGVETAVASRLAVMTQV